MKKTIFIVVLLLTACAQNDQTSYNMREKDERPQYISNHPAGKEQDNVKDDLTNQNPNFLNLDKTGNGPNKETDVDKARQVIQMTDEFEVGPIWTNAEDMWVTVYKKGMLTEKEKIDAEARIHRKLMKALPRYHIEVKVQEDRT